MDLMHPRVLKTVRSRDTSIRVSRHAVTTCFWETTWLHSGISYFWCGSWTRSSCHSTFCPWTPPLRYRNPVFKWILLTCVFMAWYYLLISVIINQQWNSRLLKCHIQFYFITLPNKFSVRPVTVFRSIALAISCVGDLDIDEKVVVFDN